MGFFNLIQVTVIWQSGCFYSVKSIMDHTLTAMEQLGIVQS